MQRSIETSDSLSELVGLWGSDATRSLDSRKRAELGQFFTSSHISTFMASLFGNPPDVVHLLDAGAGVGVLTAAVVDDLCWRKDRPHALDISLYELDTKLVSYLEAAISACEKKCLRAGISVTAKIRTEDFVSAGAEMLRSARSLFASERPAFNRAILNPPYLKIRSDSQCRADLRSVGIETSNLYTAFLAITINLLEPGGELVAITPRSFCSGPYFRPFRKLLLETMGLDRIHVFEARNKAFGADDVLQENIIFHAVKGASPNTVIVSASSGAPDEVMTERTVPFGEIVRPNDKDQVIHIPTNEMDKLVEERIGIFNQSLGQLGVEVSTGRVVDFRAKSLLRPMPEADTVPLIYPAHFTDGFVEWPKPTSRKPNALVLSDESTSLPLPNGYYALVRRFSSKEERRRVVAAVFDPQRVPGELIGFENHLNVYHTKNAGLPCDLAKGLCIYLNSTLVDSFFRQFNGHTQVNASDLRMLSYPRREVLEAFGRSFGESLPSQAEIDDILAKVLNNMTNLESTDPVKAKQKIDEALAILKAVGLPKGQQNERSALTLLALVGMKPEMSWSQSEKRLIGITPIMDFVRSHYGREYAPNSRETFRRFTMHQFVQAGLAVENPDERNRPINSPKWCYVVSDNILSLLQSFGTPLWEANLSSHLHGLLTLRERYDRHRDMNQIPVVLAGGRQIDLTAGKHSELIRAIVEEFVPKFAPGSQAIYVGDTGDKWAYFDQEALRSLGVSVDVHGKMPDVVVYDTQRRWLFLIEAVTSHGPVDSKRRIELGQLFAGAKPGLVFVTAFLTRSDMAKYLGEVSWETEVWVRESATHLIHFNGERFLGPYES